MPYQHSEDILEDKVFLPNLNRLITTATHRTVNAIDNLKRSDLTTSQNGATKTELYRLDKLSEDFRVISTLLLKSFLTTHKTIIHILRFQNEEKEDSNKTVMLHGPDAMSLVREQIEKVFVVTLLCNDPINWTEKYMKDEWRRAFEYRLKLKAENQNLPRFTEFHNKFYEQVEKGKRMFGVSDEEQQAVKFKLNNPNTELPAHLKQFSIKPFPTPGPAKKEVTEQTAKECLERWHWEYKYFCGFNHAGFSKMRFLMLSDRRFKEWFEHSDKEEMYEDKIVQTSLWTSYTACASAMSELLKYFHNDLEINAALIELWKILQERSMLGKAIWNIRAKHFFPLIY